MTFVKEILQCKSLPCDVWTVGPQEMVYKALELMAEKNVGALPVVEGGQVVGMFSERDYARKVILKDRSSRLICVADVMSQPVTCVAPSENIETCMVLMTERHIRHLPVLEDGRLVGMISIGDVLKAVIANQEIMIEDLKKFINGERS